MKKLVLLALAALMMVGCGEYKVDKNVMIGYSVVDIDSCEYIRGYSRMAHKGNCRYCQQRMRQMMWEVQDSILNTMD